MPEFNRIPKSYRMYRKHVFKGKPNSLCDEIRIALKSVKSIRKQIK